VRPFCSSRLAIRVVAAVIEYEGVASDDIVWFESRREAVGAELVIIRKSNRIPPESLPSFAALG
jgi:hypothetical protein